MSTKIYNGWKIDAVNFLDIKERMKEAAVVMQKKKEKIVIEEVSRIFHGKLERRLVDIERGETDPDKVYGEVLWDFDQECRKAEREPYHSPFCYKAEVGIIPVSRRTTLAMTFFNRVDYDKVWAKLPWVEDYHYQDQTDMPDDLTRAQWNQRRDMWEKAIGPSYLPADHCFIFRLCSSEVYPMFFGGRLKKKVAKPKLCQRERLTRLVQEKAFKERMKGKKGKPTFSELLAERKETKKWLEEKRDGKKYFRETMREFIKLTQERYL